MKKEQVFRVFIVEDDPVYQHMVRYLVEMDEDHEAHVFSDGKSCLKQLSLCPDIITLDYSLPDISGEEVLRKILHFDPDIPVIILSGQQDVGTALGLLREGAFDYIFKDAETKERLRKSLQNAKEKIRLNREVDELKSELTEKYDFQKLIIGKSPAMQGVYTLIEKAVRSDITVSIYGESGTGKELVAKCIHHHSARRKGPFVALNMSAIPKELLESELFGYEKGAFTGAQNRKKGHFELSHGGTLFLDEVAELDWSIQAKLLRALQEREFIRLGGEAPISFDARLIIATHKNLADEVAKGHFREDLYYRLLGLAIDLPPLRERGNDILLLAQHFLACNFSGKSKTPVELSKAAKNKLLSYAFPGNVRELMAVMELAGVLKEGPVVEAEDIRFSRIAKPVDVLEPNLTMEDYKNRILEYYLELCNGNVLEVAKRLQIGKSTIYRYLQEKKS